MKLRQASKRVCQFAKNVLCLLELPIVEVRAVTQAEACHEVAAIIVDSFRQPGETGCAGLVVCVRVRTALREKGAKPEDVDPDFGGPVKTYGLAVNPEALSCYGLVECG